MELTHFDEHGKAVMVDVTDKQDTVREATAAGKITVSQAVYEAVEQGKIGKGDVLGVATTAGIMGAKRTAELIPMCHILPITNCRIRFEMVPEERTIYCRCTVQGTGQDHGNRRDLSVQKDRREERSSRESSKTCIFRGRGIKVRKVFRYTAGTLRNGSAAALSTGSGEQEQDFSWTSVRLQRTERAVF